MKTPGCRFTWKVPPLSRSRKQNLSFPHLHPPDMPSPTYHVRASSISNFSAQSLVLLVAEISDSPLLSNPYRDPNPGLHKPNFPLSNSLSTTSRTPSVLHVLSGKVMEISLPASMSSVNTCLVIVFATLLYKTAVLSRRSQLQDLSRRNANPARARRMPPCSQPIWLCSLLCYIRCGKVLSHLGVILGCQKQARFYIYNFRLQDEWSLCSSLCYLNCGKLCSHRECKNHTDLVKTPRSSRTMRAYRQCMILDVFKQSDQTSDLDDDGFFEFAIASDSFETGERFWAVLWRLDKLRYPS